MNHQQNRFLKRRISRPNNSKSRVDQVLHSARAPMSPTSNHDLIESGSASINLNGLRATFYAEQSLCSQQRRCDEVEVISLTERAVGTFGEHKIPGIKQQVFRAKAQGSDASLKLSSFSTPNEFRRFNKPMQSLPKQAMRLQKLEKIQTQNKNSEKSGMAHRQPPQIQ